MWTISFSNWCFEIATGTEICCMWFYEAEDSWSTGKEFCGAYCLHFHKQNMDPECSTSLPCLEIEQAPQGPRSCISLNSLTIDSGIGVFSTDWPTGSLCESFVDSFYYNCTPIPSYKQQQQEKKKKQKQNKQKNQYGE